VLLSIDACFALLLESLLWSGAQSSEDWVRSGGPSVLPTDWFSGN